MLTKSQARTFFLVGTGLCGAAFVGLTLDTFRRIPEQTHEQHITEEVAHGKALWEANNCMGCHTLFGEGAYYAPELTKVYERRGETFIRGMLTDPQAMFPGQRKMQKYDFSDDEKDALIAFFKWAGEVDLNGFPAKPSMPTALAVPAAGAATHADERPQVFRQICVTCHSIGGQGGNVGPALDGIASRRDGDWLRKWLANPVAVKADSKMPKLDLSDKQISEVVSFLETKK
jgi:nitric oxide reductase subunit C